MKDFDLISIGDASLDAFIAPIEHEAFCTLDREQCLICFNYADKIPVSELDFSIGGNAANNAVGVSRLGLKTAILATTGSDQTGERIKKALESEGVTTQFIDIKEGKISNYSTVVRYSGERTIFVYHAPYDYKFPDNPPLSHWAYLTSMGRGFEPYYAKVVEWAKQNKTKIAFNPGSYQMKAGLTALKDIFPLLEVLFVNKEEATKFMNDANSADEKQLLAGMIQLGAKKAVITDGPNGSFAFDGEKYYRAGVLPVDAYERTGAGDAFATGCIAALVDGRDMSEAILWGTVNSASVIGHIGPQAGLLTKEQLPEWLDRAKSSGLKVEEF